MSTTVDAVVIGAGIAGLSAAAELARGTRSVVVLEMESAPAFHTTGRSAAVYIERYGGPAVSPFNLRQPPLVQIARRRAPWITRCWSRGGCWCSRRPAIRAGPGALRGARRARPSRPAEALELFPAIRPEAVGSAVFVPEAADLDAAGAVVAFRRLLRERGGSLVTYARACTALARRDGGWEVTTAAGTFRAGVVVQRGRRRGPMASPRWPGCRRSACSRCAARSAPSRCPRTWATPAGRCSWTRTSASTSSRSPASSSPRPRTRHHRSRATRARTCWTSRPRWSGCARRPRWRRAPVSTSWAGLRTFAPDRVLVLGPDPLEPSFVWCAGPGRLRHPVVAGRGTRGRHRWWTGAPCRTTWSRCGGDAATVAPRPVPRRSTAARRRVRRSASTGPTTTPRTPATRRP